MSENIKSIRQYFDNKKKFVIPNYQRGYKWGIIDSKKDTKCAVQVLMEDLFKAFHQGEGTSYFLQGVTVTETDQEIILIDGQQRTTTLFLLLKYLNYEDLDTINIKYDIRTQSDKFLKSLIEMTEETLISSCQVNKEEEFQDIFYFKKAIITIHHAFDKALKSKEDKISFIKFLLDKVKILYIQISKDKATKVFTMMNGNKADMKPEELIKSELLRLISKNEHIEIRQPATVHDALMITAETFAREWDVNALRSKYAREWDKWLYWWNNKAVKSFFNPKDKPLGLLIEYYYKIKIGNEVLEYSFNDFKNQFLKNEKSAKETFAGLRKLQKSFEDLYNDVDSYNYLGLTLSRPSNKFEAINYFIKNRKDIEKLGKYTKWSLIGVTHKAIVESEELKNYEDSKQKAEKVLGLLNQPNVYDNNDAKSEANYQLLRRNVLIENRLNGKRKFDFNIFGEKSLEHIHPKSKEKELNNLSDKLSVHSIGNLVLLDKNTNSSFNDSYFDKKKEKYFSNDYVKWSLKLLHSISIFSTEKWDEKNIETNQKEFIDEFENYYDIKSK